MGREEYPLIDSQGKRYRRVGNSLEYEPEIVTTFGTFPKGSYSEPRKIEIPIPKIRKDCPFKTSHYINCDGNCSFFCDEKCCPGVAQAGKRCPLPGRITCGEGCMLYENGHCALFKARKGE